jgi:uncharacterized protein
MKNYEAIKQFVIDKLDKNLPHNLFYHGLHHTKSVLKSAEFIARDEKISDEDMALLKVAVLFHDAGFLKTYKQHEEAGCEMAKAELPQFGITEKDIEIICGMIMATKIPQNPKTQLERIIADADLEYLGTDEFDKIGDTLFEEVKIYLNVESRRQWDVIQVNFLKSHHYFTRFCQQNREPEKQRHLKEVEQRLG